MLLEEGVCYDQCILLAKLYEPLPYYVLYSKAKFLEKAEEPEIKMPTSAGLLKKQESTRKISISTLLTMPKTFDCVDHKKLWKILKEMGISDHLTCLLRNRYAGQEATVRTGHGTTDWFQIGDRKSTRLNSSHYTRSRMPSSA